MNRQQSTANQSVGQRRMSDGRSLQSYTQRVTARMTREEAVKAVVRMMSAYPTFRCSEESMLTFAEALLQFPLETAMAAASPIHGAPKKYKDYPLTAGQLIEWCEQAAESLYEHAKFERERSTLRLAAPTQPPLTAAELESMRRKYPQFFPVPGSKCDTRRPRHSRNEVADAQATLDRYAAEAQREPQREAAE